MQGQLWTEKLLSPLVRHALSLSLCPSKSVTQHTHTHTHTHTHFLSVTKTVCLPVPGGPVRIAPLGILAPRSTYCWGFFRKLTNSMISTLASSHPATSLCTTWERNAHHANKNSSNTTTTTTTTSTAAKTTTRTLQQEHWSLPSPHCAVNCSHGHSAVVCKTGVIIM